MTSNSRQQEIESLKESIINKNTVKVKKSKKILYSDMFSEEPLKHYLSIISDVSKTNFDTDLFTNIFRSGFKSDLEEPREISCDFKDCTITGTVYAYDKQTDSIILPVVLSTNRIMEIKKRSKTNKYIIDITMLKYIYEKINNRKIGTTIVAIDKLFTHYKKMPTELLNIIDIKNHLSTKEIELLISKRIKELSTEPEKCENIRWHKKYGKNINMSCSFYCDYNKICKKQFGTNRQPKITQNSLFF
jgi:hypothetical protein